MRWTALFVKYADPSVKDISLITAVIVLIDRDDSDLISFKMLDRLARGRRFSSGGTDLCTRALTGVKLENLEGGKSNMITVTGDSKVSEVFDNEVLRRKPIIWFELESPSVKNHAPKTAKIRKSSMAPSCKENNIRAAHIKFRPIVDPSFLKQSATGRSIQFELTAKPKLEGVLEAIGLDPHLASRIARAEQVPKKETRKNTTNMIIVKELYLPQKRQDDIGKVIVKKEEVFQEVHGGDDHWYNDDGYNCVMDGSGNCLDDDCCEEIDNDDNQKFDDDDDSRNCDVSSEIDDDYGNANAHIMSIDEEVASCKNELETVEECVQMEASSNFCCNTSSATAHEIIMIDDHDSCEEKDEEVLPVTECEQVECRKRNRKEYEIVTREHDIYNIDEDDDDDDSESDTSDDDDGMHTIAQNIHTASSSDMKKAISKSPTSASASISVPASTNVGFKASTCVCAAAIEQHARHESPMMTITRHPIDEQVTFDLSPLIKEEITDCVSTRPLDIAFESRNE